ncbi:CAP domain-containing protein [uncultured Oscillibacter sp.]|uniref:CAP domain-containing protein n=1 Tax=uncultured Oscillibacter sp. TaxID=876091 RepID=UPI002606B1CB|nr:CAP domain-containing protein [uncultured Oscillibacter sp.]
MSRFKRDMSMILMGLALGAVLTGGAVAAGITAEPAWSPIYVDGQQVHMIAYNILGNNYVKLRDIGKAVGFNVYYQDGVQVDSTAPYTGESPMKDAAQPASSSAGTLKVSSVKGTELTIGERSSLLISPSGTNCTAISSNPSIVSLEQVAGYWVVVPQAPGSATVTVTSPSGESGSLVFTVKADASAPAEIDLNANMEIRQEMVRLINEVRQEHGLAILPVNDALMDAAQDVSTQCVPEHRPYDSKILPKYGWSHGAMYNLVTMGLDDFDNAAQVAVTAWVNSPGHLKTMLMEDATCVGTGVTNSGYRVYCYMVVGSPDWVSAYS